MLSYVFIVAGMIWSSVSSSYDIIKIKISPPKAQYTC